MSSISLSDIEFVEAPDQFSPAEAENYYEVARTHDQVVYHHPGVRVTDVDAWLETLNGQVEDYHLIVDGSRIVQRANFEHVVFAAARAHTDEQWNTDSIHVCVIPETVDYEFMGEVHKFIEGYYGSLPGIRHGDLMPTECPGSINVTTIIRYARGKGDNMPREIDGRNIRELHAHAIKLHKSRNRWRTKARELQTELTSVHSELDDSNDTKARLRSRLEDMQKEMDKMQKGDSIDVGVGAETRSWIERLIGFFRR